MTGSLKNSVLTSTDSIFSGSKKNSGRWPTPEISTGAQREHRVDVLEAQAAEKGLSASDLEHYLDFFRHGVPPHGGFGMGLARVMMLMLGQSSIRETTYLFRGPNRLLP